jgi:nifR3 family TIM-barrel protein
MGCPARQVSGALAGAAFMRDLDRAEGILAGIVKAVSVPVTVKMRLGWDENSKNALELARRAERAGVRMATVHGRTRAQFYSGRANWRALRPVVEAVGIPIVVNGDCTSLQDARAMLDQSGASAVMIGRAAVGAPWLVGAVSRALANGDPLRLPSVAQRLEAALEHLDWLVDKFGPRAGLRHSRKHLAAYARTAGAPVELQRNLVTADEPAQARDLLESAFHIAPLRAVA